MSPVCCAGPNAAGKICPSTDKSAQPDVAEGYHRRVWLSLVVALQRLPHARFRLGTASNVLGTVTPASNVGLLGVTVLGVAFVLRR